MPDTNQILRDLIARVDALEQDNTMLKQENRVVRSSMAQFVGRATTAPERAISEPDAPLSRRHLLRRAAQVTAATLVAGAMLQRDDRGVSASHSETDIDANEVYAHYVSGSSGDGYFAIAGHTQSDNYPAISGLNSGTAAGVEGWSYAGRGIRGTGLYGVHGLTTHTGGIGVYGENLETGSGVVGDGKGVEHGGVVGRNSTGDGVRGEGKVGVRAKATHAAGYGALIEGGKAQLRIVPKATAGKPTSGTHTKGELLLDSTATLWICTAPGTPGTWRKVSTTVA